MDKVLERSSYVKSRPKKNGFIFEMKKNNMLYLLMVPGILFFIIFKYVPMYGLIIAFKDYHPWVGVMDSQWVGFKFFKDFLTGSQFIPVLRNTLVISALKLIFASPCPLILALLLNEIKGQHFKRISQTITYLPHFLSWVIIYGLCFSMFNENFGTVNSILSSLGFEKVSFLTEKNLFWPMQLFTHIWKNVGWGSIIYLAAISGIGPELYESASMDGCNKWQQMRYITIPAVLPVFAILFVLALGNILNEDFEQILMFMGGPQATYMTDVGEVFETYVFRTGLMEAKYSFSTAVSVFKSVFGLILVVISNSVAKKRFNYRGIW